MTTAIIGLATVVVIFLTALVGVWRELRKTRDISTKNQEMIGRLEVNVDGRLSELLKNYGELKHALGVTEGERLQRERERERESGGGKDVDGGEGRSSSELDAG
jgi:hypothetical protein